MPAEIVVRTALKMCKRGALKLHQFFCARVALAELRTVAHSMGAFLAQCVGMVAIEDSILAHCLVPALRVFRTLRYTSLDE